MRIPPSDFSVKFFDYFAKRNIADMEAELNGTKRIPGAAVR